MNNVSTVIELMIEAERSQMKPAFHDRIAALSSLKNQLDLRGDQNIFFNEEQPIVIAKPDGKLIEESQEDSWEEELEEEEVNWDVT